MLILALDTCLNACAVAVLDGERTLAHDSEVMARGHQERLAPMAERVMRASGRSFADLDRIAVTVGPGSFTGLRVGLAFAKGLGAALGVPVVGVGVLEALAAQAPPSTQEGGLVFAALDARRDQLYLQAFDDGRALMAPDALPAPIAAARVAELAMGRSATFVGSGGPLLAGVIPGATVIAADGADPRRVAQLAAGRPATPPRPLYLRAPDAKLPAAKLPVAGTPA